MDRVCRSASALLLAAFATACGSEPGSREASSPTSDEQPERGPAIHVLERHSSALIAWREAGATDRIVVHLDALPDIDWLPDEAIARIAASSATEIAALESNPFVVESDPLARFSSDNFLYAASRLGIVREVVWVAPDETFAEKGGVRRLVQDLLIGRPQMVTESDARSFHQDGALIRGTILGIPIVVCRLADLPRIEEPVLLDIDLDYFTIRSSVSQMVDPAPWVLPGRVIELLEAKGVEAEIITIALSTIAGTAPPESRWIARDLRRILRALDPPADSDANGRVEGLRAESAGDAARAVAIYRELAGARADDGSVFYVLARALDSIGRTLESGSARARAERLDPLLARADLFEAERLFINGAWDAALIRYTAYAQDKSDDGSAPWVLRRRAACLLRLGRQDEALAAFKALVSGAPDSAVFQAELGAILLDLRDVPGAVTHLAEARRLAPDIASYAFALGNAYLQAGREEDGIREIEACIARRPCYVQARARLAGALANVGRIEEARRHIEFAIALQPANPRFRILGRQLGLRGVTAGSPTPTSGRP